MCRSFWLVPAIPALAVAVPISLLDFPESLAKIRWGFILVHKHQAEKHDEH
jgi:hypothetical protein